MKKVKISRLNHGDQFEYDGQKYIVLHTVIGFGTEVIVKSVKNGQSIRIYKDAEVTVE